MYWDLPIAERPSFFFNVHYVNAESFPEMTKDGEKKSDETFTNAASTTTINVATTAFSFLGAFMLRDVFQNIFEKIENKFGMKDRMPGWKLVWTLFTFTIVVLILVWLASLKKRQLQKQEKLRVAKDKKANDSEKAD